VPLVRTALVLAFGGVLASSAACSVADLTAGGPLEAGGAGPVAPHDATDVEAGDQDGADDGSSPAAEGSADGAPGAEACAGPAFTAPTTPVVIENLLNNRYLDVAHLSTTDGAQVWAWSYTGGSNQLWTFMGMGDGTYEIVNQASGKCLEVRGGTTGNGSYIQQYGCWGGDNQRWSVVLCQGYIQIVGKQSGRCLSSSALLDGATVTLWDCSNASSEQWAVAR